ncbi:HAD family hydrolase [Nocardioides sp. SR21]|uniref:HAD family hydrolase n=1 Tax=Nocardioides sp. SR21 TaxID=2919501 RepID=UPI001FA9F581|nr:HAD-IA family hydrolase [Nocardioides sp. SR21]
MIQHVLLDADGVVQTLPDMRRAATAVELVGDRADDLLDALFAVEGPTLRGDGDFLPQLTRILLEHGITADPVSLYGTLWNAVEPSADVLALVASLRAAGYGVHLGTNQHRERATYLRTVLGYDAVFDVGCYSCELGAAKPSPEFFAGALALIGAAADEVLFVDDSLANVEAARAAGLVAEHWDLAQGLPALVGLLSGHGVTV